MDLGEATKFAEFNNRVNRLVVDGNLLTRSDLGYYRCTITASEVVFDELHEY